MPFEYGRDYIARVAVMIWGSWNSLIVFSFFD